MDPTRGEDDAPVQYSKAVLGARFRRLLQDVEQERSDRELIVEVLDLCADLFGQAWVDDLPAADLEELRRLEARLLARLAVQDAQEPC